MDTADLRHAYASFAETARRGPFATPTAGGWSAELILAHVVVGDRLIAEAAALAMATGRAQFDNAAALVEPYLQSVVQAAGNWDGLVAAVTRGGDELIALAERMTEAQAAVPVPARIVSDGQVVLDASVPIGGLVNGPANVHLRLHSEQLSSLIRLPADLAPSGTGR